MNNYASLGVDALVTLNFHKRRQNWPRIFANRIINKVMSALFHVMKSGKIFT